MERRKWLGGNWKCNASKESVTELLRHFNEVKTKSEKLDLVLFPPSLYVEHTQRELKTGAFELGLQNFSQSKNGAFTGELSVPMIKDVGLRWSLVGHSERRQLFKEEDADVASKVKILQDNGLYASVCVGETLSERENGETESVLRRQLDAFVPEVKYWHLVVVAYEPVWAIGTGKVATVDQVRDAHKFIREHLRSAVGNVADSVRIVYGGSVNAKNCVELARCEGVDGFLVGGVSLKPEFLEVLKSLE